MRILMKASVHGIYSLKGQRLPTKIFDEALAVLKSCGNGQALVENYRVWPASKKDLKEDVLPCLATAMIHNNMAVVKAILASFPDIDKSRALHCATAVTDGSPNHEIVEMLIAAGVDVDQAWEGDVPSASNTKAPIGYTPLFASSKRGHLEIVKKLISAEVDVDKVCVHVTSGHKPKRIDMTALSIAANEGHLEVVKELLEAGHADPNKTTPLAFAVYHGHVNLVRLLLERGADALLECGPGAHHAVNEGVSWTCVGGRLTVSRWGCEPRECGGANDNPDANRATDGVTPLYIAAREGHVDVARLLLDRGRADANWRARDNGATPLCSAVKKRHVDVARLLLERGRADANLTFGDGVSPLNLAAENGHVDMLQLLLDRGRADATQADNHGRNPLHFAAAGGHAAVARLLLELGRTDANRATNDGETPLQLAAQFGHVEIVRLLLERGRPGVLTGQGGRRTDVNRPDVDGYTPMLWAALRGHVEVARLLLEDGRVDITRKANDGANALLFAAQEGHVEVVRLLLEDGHADPNAAIFFEAGARDNGTTPLFMAVQEGHVGVVRCLLDCDRTDANQATAVGNTPLYAAVHAAVAKDDVECLKRLLAVDGILVNKTGVGVHASPPLFMAAGDGHF